MVEKNVPVDMRAALSMQLTNWFEKKSAFDEEELLANLPPKQRKDLLITIYKPFLVNCPLMQVPSPPAILPSCGSAVREPLQP